MIEGFATPKGTTNFARKSLARNENFRKIHDLTLSNVGVGTYLGNTDLETDTQQKKKNSRTINPQIPNWINLECMKANEKVNEQLKTLYN